MINREKWIDNKENPCALYIIFIIPAVAFLSFSHSNWMQRFSILAHKKKTQYSIITQSGSNKTIFICAAVGWFSSFYESNQAAMNTFIHANTFAVAFSSLYSVITVYSIDTLLMNLNVPKVNSKRFCALRYLRNVMHGYGILSIRLVSSTDILIISIWRMYQPSHWTMALISHEWNSFCDER